MEEEDFTHVSTDVIMLCLENIRMSSRASRDPTYRNIEVSFPDTEIRT